jgi:trans-aconitate methyltransferase
MYDYFLGGIHNFPADQEAARAVIARRPDVPLLARANRAFLGRATWYLIHAGVRQFLDIGSSIPTEGNVHEIAQAAASASRVVYVDIDPVAVAESLELLDGNPHATAVRGDLRTPQAILDHRAVPSLLDFTQPIDLLLAAVLHFVPDDAQACDILAHLIAALPPGSYLAISHGAAETFQPSAEGATAAAKVYQTQTATPGKARTRTAVQGFFTGLNVVEPGAVWAHQWHPDPNQPVPALLTADPQRSGEWAGMGKKA